MTSKTSQTYFKHLTNKEKASKIHQVAKEKGSVTMWEKGSPQRLSVNIHYFDKNENKLYLANKETKLVGKDILYSFSLAGLSFFGQAKLTKVGSELVMDCKGDLFKTERRKNFRLLTYPAHSVYVAIKLEGYAEQSNVIQMQTGMSQTGLFNKFLNMIGDEEGQKFETGYVPIRVQDISVTGLGIVVGEIEKEFIQQGMRTGPLHIDFGNERIIVDDAEVVYIVEAITGLSNSKAYKVGIHFLNVTEEVDGKLGARINSLIRVTDDKEFEDFIK